MKSLVDATITAETENTQSSTKVRNTARITIRVVTWILVAVALLSGISQYQTYRQKVVGQQVNQQVRGCPQYGSTQPEECTVTETGITLSTTEIMRPGEFELCHVLPSGGTFKSEWVNSSTLKLTSTAGPFPIRYKLFRRDALVNGKCPNRF